MDRYTINTCLGAGAAGEALVVTEKSTGNEYVLKRIHTLGMDREERERASREAKTLQMLNHPNIVRFKESFFDKDPKTKEEFFCIIMERCVCSLEDLINQCLEIPDEKGGFPQSLLVEWMTELLAALSFLQQKNIIHRDIKSSNIFVTKKNHLKIGDFGLAKVHSPAATGNNTNATKDDALMKASATIAGTAHYMPPEVCDGAATDHKGDVWSLGILFYELCALHPPFQGGNILAIVNEITTKTPDPLPSNFDGRFTKITMWMLQKDAKKRPTAQDVLNKYVFLPPSHPSHPQHDPDRGRHIQEKHGPPLVLNAGGRRSNSVAVGSGSSSKNASNNNNNKENAPSSKTAAAVNAANKRENQIQQQQQKPEVHNNNNNNTNNKSQPNSNSNSPSGRVDGNRHHHHPQTQQKQAHHRHSHHHHHHHVTKHGHHNHHPEPHHHNEQQKPSSSIPPPPQHLDRPSAVVLDDDTNSDDEDENTNNEKTMKKLGEDVLVMTTSNLNTNSSGSDENSDNHASGIEAIMSDDETKNNNSKKSPSPTNPQAFLDDETTTAGDINNNHHHDNKNKHQQQQPSAMLMGSTDSTRNNNNQNPPPPTTTTSIINRNSASNSNNNNNHTSLEDTTTTTNGSTASSDVERTRPQQQQQGWNLKERILALLEAESVIATVTASDLDDVVCAIAEFRQKKGLDGK